MPEATSPKLTQKQDVVCQRYIELGNASDGQTAWIGGCPSRRLPPVDQDGLESVPRHKAVADRLQNVSTTAGESDGFGWTAVNKTERRNDLGLKRLRPEVARHHQLRKHACSEFESLPPSHEICPAFSVTCSTG
jgi:hypothetical protein